MCAATRNFALLYELRGEYDEAQRLYQEALDESRRLDSEHLQVGILSDLGVLHISTENWQASLDACDAALAMAEEHQWLHYVEVNQLNRAEALVRLQRFDEALAAVDGLEHRAHSNVPTTFR